jgi:hypothetical protein
VQLTIISLPWTLLVIIALSGAGAATSRVLLLPSIEKSPTRPSPEAEIRKPEKTAVSTMFAACPPCSRHKNTVPKATEHTCVRTVANRVSSQQMGFAMQISPACGQPDLLRHHRPAPVQPHQRTSGWQLAPQPGTCTYQAAATHEAQQSEISTSTRYIAANCVHNPQGRASTGKKERRGDGTPRCDNSK